MDTNFIPTRGSSVKNNPTSNFQSTVFESYKSHKNTRKETIEANLKVTSVGKGDAKNEEFNIKKAKQEIIKLGTSHLDPVEKEKAKIQLAIKLGAKPPKNKFKNYKELQREQIKSKAAQKDKISFQQLGKNSLGKSTAKGKGFNRKRKVGRGQGGLLDVYGRVKVTKS